MVDFKLTSGEVGENHRAQLTAYSMMAETRWGVRSDVAFLYRIPDCQVFSVEITEGMREGVRQAVAGILGMTETQRFPGATAVRGRCVDCEYANYCGDVL